MRGISLSVGVLALGAAALGSEAVATQTPAPPTPAPPTPATQADVTACQACHGANGIARNTNLPNLAGQQAGYLAAQLRAFRAGTRRNDLMQAIAGQLSDDQITALAAYWNARLAGGGDVHSPAASGPAIPSRMTFPAGFPTGFTRYATVTEEGAVTERYANAAAVDAARAGRPLPDGSVLVTVNRPAAGAAPSSFSAMESRAGWGAAIPALLRNGNWDYALFDAQGVRNDRLNQAQCLACHKPRAADSYVFTIAELRAPPAR